MKWDKRRTCWQENSNPAADSPVAYLRLATQAAPQASGDLLNRTVTITKY